MTNDKTQKLIQKMKNEETLLKRKEYKDPFTIVDNSVVQDPKMSWSARGMYTFIKSLPQDWILYESWLIKQSPQGRDANRTILKELEKFGFINRYTYRYKGKIIKHEMVFSVKPIPENELIKFIKIKDDGTFEKVYQKPESENPFMTQSIENTHIEPESGFPEVVKPEVVNPHLQNKHIYKTNIYTNQSITTEKNKNNYYVNNDRQTDKEQQTELKKLKNILNNCGLKDIKEGRTSQAKFTQYTKTLEQAIRLLFFNKQGLRMKDSYIPHHLIREDLKKINQFVLEHAIVKFEKASRQKAIRNTTAYLATCIYDSIYSIDLDIQNELLNNYII